jgi:hypothetical protein
VQPGGLLCYCPRVLSEGRGSVRIFGRPNVRVTYVAAALAAMFLSACSSAGSDEKPPAGRRETATVLESPDAIEQAKGRALAAYRAMWHDLTIASATSDISSPLLDDHASGAALQLMKYGLRKAAKKKVVTQGAPRIDPEVLSATTGRITLRDCVDDTRWLNYKLNGELENDVPGGHSKTDVIVSRVGDTWKVSYFYLHGDGSC